MIKLPPHARSLMQDRRVSMLLKKEKKQNRGRVECRGSVFVFLNSQAVGGRLELFLVERIEYQCCSFCVLGLSMGFRSRSLFSNRHLMLCRWSRFLADVTPPRWFWVLPRQTSVSIITQGSKVLGRAEKRQRKVKQGIETRWCSS